MNKQVNYIILNINAYASWQGRDMAGSLRVRNIFDTLLKNQQATVSNLIPLDLLAMEHHQKQQSTHEEVDCLSIGYSSIKNPLSVWSYLKTGFRFIKEHLKKDQPNVLYNYQYPDIRNILFIWYARKLGYRIVFDLVEDKNHEAAHTFNDRIRRRITLFFTRLLPKIGDAVFVISDHLYQMTTAITQNRIPVIMLPVSVDFSNLQPNAPVTPGEPVRIFYGGSFAAKDGLPFLIQAVEAVSQKRTDFKVLLSGKGRPEDMERILSGISNKSLIDYKGFLSTEAYFQLLASVHICCMTRNNSAFANAGFPFKLGEFMAAGKVIIASKVGDVPKYLNNQESACLVEPENSAQIAEALDYCISNAQELATTMGEKARAIALQHFDSRVSAATVLQHSLALFEKPKA